MTTRLLSKAMQFTSRDQSGVSDGTTLGFRISFLKAHSQSLSSSSATAVFPPPPVLIPRATYSSPSCPSADRCCNRGSFCFTASTSTSMRSKSAVICTVSMQALQTQDKPSQVTLTLYLGASPLKLPECHNLLFDVSVLVD